MKHKAAAQVDEIVIDSVPIQLVRKKIKNIHLRIYPTGQVRVSAPLYMKLPRVMVFLESKMLWIKQKREYFTKLNYKAPTKLKYRDGETHLFLGKEYLLRVHDYDKAALVVMDGEMIVMKIRKNSTIKKRQALLEDWYRCQLKELIVQFIAQYEAMMLVVVKEFGVKKMKTRWGTCNPVAQRIWLNLELAKYPLKCLEYIVVHEMVHLLEANHSKRFYANMDKFMPGWKEWQRLLNGKRE